MNPSPDPVALMGLLAPITGVASLPRGDRASADLVALMGLLAPITGVASLPRGFVL